MTVFEAISRRYSVRDYRPDPVPEEALNRLLEAARLAPSAGNRQEWQFVVVREEAKRAALCAAANNQAFIAQAPVVIVACAEAVSHVMRCGHPSYVIDVAIALEHISLQATEEGLGTCWVGAFSQEPVKEALGIPAEVQVVQLMSLGYPADQARPKSRKTMEEIVCYEAWE
jgi:nitroreductase